MTQNANSQQTITQHCYFHTIKGNNIEDLFTLSHKRLSEGLAGFIVSFSPTESKSDCYPSNLCFAAVNRVSTVYLIPPHRLWHKHYLLKGWENWPFVQSDYIPWKPATVWDFYGCRLKEAVEDCQWEGKRKKILIILYLCKLLQLFVEV